MPEDKDESRGRFERQRRNLMIVSVLLIIYITLELNLETINILGNTFAISNNNNVEFLIWIFFIYFLIRYYQYYKVVNNSEFLKIYYDSMEKYVARVAFNNFKKIDATILKEENPDGSNFKYNLSSHEIFRKDSWRWKLKISGTRTWILEGGAGSSNFSVQESNIINFQLVWPKVKSYIVVYFQTPHITEYFLPFALSIITIIVKVNYS